MKTQEITPKEKEEMQNIETNKRREILNNYFNRNYNIEKERKPNIEDTTTFKPFKDTSDDELEKTGKIDSIGINDLEKLKKLVAELKEMDKEEVGSSKSKPKVLRKTNPNQRRYEQTEPEENTDEEESITHYFERFFILVLVTAAIGTGWLLYIINQIQSTLL